MHFFFFIFAYLTILHLYLAEMWHLIFQALMKNVWTFSRIISESTFAKWSMVVWGVCWLLWSPTVSQVSERKSMQRIISYLSIMQLFFFFFRLTFCCFFIHHRKLNFILTFPVPVRTFNHITISVWFVFVLQNLVLFLFFSLVQGIAQIHGIALPVHTILHDILVQLLLAERVRTLHSQISWIN